MHVRLRHGRQGGLCAAVLTAALLAGCSGGTSGTPSAASSAATSSPAPSSTELSSAAPSSTSASAAVPTSSSAATAALSTPSSTAAARTSRSAGPTKPTAQTTKEPTITPTSSPKKRTTAPTAKSPSGSATTVCPFKINTAAGPKSWPNVCTFTTAAQLKALDPQITGLKGKPVGTKSNIIGAGGGSTPFPTDCKFNLTTKFDKADTAGNPSWVDISLSIVDTTAPEVFKQDETSTSVRKFAGLPGGASCYADTGNLLTCLTGNIVYNINGTKDTGGANFQADQEKWLTKIDLPLAKKLATELSSS